jgi:phospholipid/cholesterol/gamma-HCH transport system substrate-binding protein
MQTRPAEAIKVGLFFFLGLILSYILYETLSQANFYEDVGYSVKAIFTDLKQLKVGDEVRLSGVHIGNVNKTNLENELAVAILNIEKQFKIPKDSIATIVNAGLLGANYVAITAGKSPEDITSGGPITTQYTPDISSVITQLGKIGERVDGILSGLSDSITDSNQKDGDKKDPNKKPSQSRSLFSNLNDFLSTNRSKIDHSSENIDSITTKVASGSGTIGKLVNDNTAYDSFLSTVTKIQEAAKSADELFADLKNLSQSAQNGNGVLATLISDKDFNAQVKDIVKNFDSFSQKLNNAQSTLNRLISDDILYKKAENTLNRIDKATDTMATGGPITAVGVAAKALF